MKVFSEKDLANINGGGNILDCAGGIGASAGVIGAVAGASGPIGWVALGALGVSAAAAGFVTGYSCSALAHKGD